MLSNTELENLNDKINIIKQNMINNPFFNDYKENLYSMYYYLINNIEIKNLTNGPEKYVSLKEAFSLVYNFLDKISNNYSKELDNDIKNGKIFTSSSNYYDQDNKKIYLNFENNINDSIHLLHEYIHKLSNKISNSKSQRDSYFVYDEAIAILGELYFKDYLLKNNFSKYDIDLINNIRKKELINSAYSYLILYPLYDIYINKGNIDNNDLINLKNKKILLYRNDEEVKNNINIILNKEIQKLPYKHVFGTIVSTYLYNQNISLETYKNMIEDLDTMTLVDFSNKYNINFEFEKAIKDVCEIYKLKEEEKTK